jgi:hypothetical protein
MNQQQKATINMKISHMCSLAFLLMLFACSSNVPNELSGRWICHGPIPMEIEFRDGETESMGMIEKVSYKKDDNSYLVTGESGLDKGMTIRYQIIDASTIRCTFGVFHKASK